MKLPVSAIVVGYNEAPLLRESLPRLSFCDEILYFDLGSADDSVQLATQYGATVIHHAKVDGCEWIHAEYAHTTRHDWILITDPDEVIDPALEAEITNLFKNNLLTADTGAVSVPIYYYFKKKKLEGTAWGGENYRLLLAHNKRFVFSPFVHAGRAIAEGYHYLTIRNTGRNGVHHYWMQTYKALWSKHKRYLKNEGSARYKIGERVSLKRLLLSPLKEFKYSYVGKRGYKDGVTGIFLSLFWAWYQFSARYRLFKFQISEQKRLNE